MNKTVYKVLSIIMALCVFLGLMPVTVYAEDELEVIEDIDIIRFSPDTELEPEFNTNANKFYSNTDIDTSRYFYNQLTANQKALYNQIKAAGFVQKVTIDLTGLSFSGKGTSSSVAKSNAANQAQQDIIMAVSALGEDDPLHFWMDGFGMSYAGSSQSSGGAYTYTISTLIVSINIDTQHYANYNEVEAKYNAVVEKLATIPVNGISRHEKLKSINDYLTETIEYDSTISKPNIYDVYGALITGVCVCEGYAEAFKLLCDREGIPCITVVGTGNGGAHKWNMVLMEDGEWYTLDSTWNDQTEDASYTFYSYFLIGSNTKAPYFSSSSADSAVHIPTGKMYNNAQVALVYPTLSTDTYGVGLLSYGAEDIHFDTARGVIMVGKDVTNYQNFIVSGTAGFTRTKTGTGTTTSTLKVSDGTTTRTYLVSMRGDVDANNTVNNTDYSLLAQISATTYRVEENSAEFYAGDMNQDGAIDGFDVIAQELYTDGTLLYN